MIPGFTPRQPDLADQLDLAQRISRGMKASSDAYHQVAKLRKALTERTDALKQSESKETKDAVAAFEKKIDAVDKGTKTRSGIRTREPRPGPAHLQRGERRHASGGHGPVGGTTELRCPRQGSGELAAVERAGYRCLQRSTYRQSTGAIAYRYWNRQHGLQAVGMWASAVPQSLSGGVASSLRANYQPAGS